MQKAILRLWMAILAMTLAGALWAGAGNFRAHLSGGNEVPPVDTKATGQAIFKLRGSEMRYKINVGNIDNVFAAHLHCAPEGNNGPVGVTLFASNPGGGRINGTLVQGVITAPNPGNMCLWTTLDDVVTAMMSGQVYVNVHTNPGTPSGELRGQVF